MRKEERLEKRREIKENEETPKKERKPKNGVNERFGERLSGRLSETLMRRKIHLKRGNS